MTKFYFKYLVIKAFFKTIRIQLLINIEINTATIIKMFRHGLELEVLDFVLVGNWQIKWRN